MSKKHLGLITHLNLINVWFYYIFRNPLLFVVTIFETPTFSYKSMTILGDDPQFKKLGSNKLYY